MKMNRTEEEEKEETSNERFKRIGLKRTNKVLEDIRMLGRLFNNQYRYKYTDKQAQKIIRFLESQVETLKRQSYSGQNSEFKWKEDND